MEPLYMNENRYSHLVGFWKPPTNVDYEAESPETEFEWRVQTLFMQGQRHLHREEYLPALRAFRELMALILRTANPQMPVDPNQMPWFVFPMDVALVDTLTAKTVEILQKTPVPVYKFPPALMSEQSILPGPVIEKLKPAFQQGLQITSHHIAVNERLEAALAAIEEENFGLALRHYAIALNKTPEVDSVLRASLLHDMAILAEKSDNRNQAQEFAQRSAQTFEATKLPAAQVQALDTLTGILRRDGKEDLATEQAKRAIDIRKKNNINPVVSDRLAALSAKTVVRSIRTATLGTTEPLRVEPIAPDITRTAPLATALRTTADSTVDAPTLMAMKYVQASAVTKSLAIQGATTAATIKLDANAVANVRGFLQTISDTKDLQLVTDFWYTRIQMMAYLPHMYFFVIPMSIGDCFAGMGNLRQAEEQYRSVLPYPFINKQYEIVKLWTRLAQVYLDTGDKAYRVAKDNINAFGPARAAYENIVRSNKTLNANSPLYQDAKFASIKTRVTNFLAAADPLAFNDNPAITRLVLEAFSRLQQIQAGLNFFGFDPDYTPPFSFEYLQNTARYFSQQASQIEQRYIQYKSQAENEEFRREQLDQQAEVARQSVVLEQRGVAEAQAGIAVAQASLDYAEVQRQNAVKVQQDFATVRWELLALTATEAWANAASVDQDDEVLLTVHGFGYYSAKDMRRSAVLQDLAYRRTQISHDLEATKLQRAIDSAAAYKQVAHAQVNQAQARKAIAEQRVKIAQLQQKQAEENRDFLDMREFSARLWYELAMQARRLKQHYLDMATEIAFLMERAYNAETERNLRVIRYDYANTAANNLMGADLLLADIDYFTYDHMTTTKTKKIPVKQIISLADSYVMSFQQLKNAGCCFFQTELADFDRQHPGMYLCKLRNVEIVFVGLANVASLAGMLRNVGVSRFRREDGSIVPRLYPADVMALSQYEIRQDALTFRFNPNDLRLFENNGIDTLWQLDLPINANDFDYKDILDIQIILYYDGLFSPSLETTIKAALPARDMASRAFSLRMSFFDELYYLKNKGEGDLYFGANLFPRNYKNFKRTLVTLKATGNPDTVGNLKLRLTSANHDGELLLTTDAQGEVNQATPGQPLSALKNESMLDTWTLRITANDNPALVSNGVLDLTGLDDILIFFEYSFDYR
ncbi:hypothetical protein HZA56_01460 [Candidatus Poribacteria bacterium]|nr:hypothetical protein [Candidatus Poribacteria bacterium]